ncbi:hypothetical protein BGX21_007036, partial [Mortierella sp. AD011]
LYFNTVLAVGSLVPNSEGDGHLPPDSNTQESRQATSRKRSKYPRSQSALESLGMESKRTALSAAGLSEAVQGFILGNKAAVMTQKRYLPAQREFLAWLEEGSFEAGINPTVPIINWLHHVMATRNLAWTTVMSMKSATLALFADTRSITIDPLYQQFIRAGRFETVHHTRQEDYDISPVLQYFRDLEDNATVDLAILTQKLCWLLGVCGFMRPDDIRCTDVKLSGVVRDKLQLTVVFPKEKRNGQRIIKHITIGGHPDSALCPMMAYTAYLARLDKVDIRVPHPKDPTREYNARQ